MNDTPVACQTRGPTDPQGDRWRGEAVMDEVSPPQRIISRTGAGTCLRRPHFFQQRKKWGERTPAETAFLHFLSALCLFAAARAFPHVTGVFLVVVVPPTVPAQLSAAAACYYGKNYSFCRVAG